MIYLNTIFFWTYYEISLELVLMKEGFDGKNKRYQRQQRVTGRLIVLTSRSIRTPKLPVQAINGSSV